MYYIVTINDVTLRVSNLITGDGCSYLFRRSFDREYTFLDTFKYTLIDNAGFVAIADTDTLSNRQWLPFPLSVTYNYDPTLLLTSQDGSIKGNRVDIHIPNNGTIAGIAIVGTIILSVAVFDDPQPIKKDDIISLIYNMDLP